MKELEVTLTLRNNLLKERRLKMGLSQEQLAKKIGISMQSYGGLEVMRDSPIGKDGTWREPARLIAKFYKIKIDDLFPCRLSKNNFPKNKAVKKIDTEEVPQLFSSHQERLLLSSPETELEEVELATELRKALTKLTPREEKILREIYFEDKTEQEIAEEQGVTKTRINQISRKALNKLRHPSRSKTLRSCIGINSSRCVKCKGVGYFNCFGWARTCDNCEGRGWV